MSRDAEGVGDRNFGAPSVSVGAVRQSTAHLRHVVFVAALLAAAPIFAAPVAAQRGRAVQPFTGYELALRGGHVVRLGRDNRFRGVAYRVRGLAELVPYQGPVRFAFTRVVDLEAADPADSGLTWVASPAGADGTFVVDVPIPANAPDSGGSSRPRLLVQVGPPGAARQFEIDLTEQPAVEVMLRTDRALYEAGETVHVWALLTDAATHRPLAGLPLRLAIGSGIADALPPRTESIVTSAAGVAHLEMPIPPGTPEGTVRVHVDVPGQTSRELSFRIGTRAWQRMMATVSISPAMVAPSGVARAEVRVTTPSGAPVADAAVTGRLDGSDSSYGGRTGADGRVAFSIRTPAFLVHETGSLGFRVQANHAAHGAASAYGTIRLAVPLALGIEVFPAHGGLVPEVDEPLYVRLRDGAGRPPPAGTEVRVEGPVFPRGVATAVTDDNGLAVVTARAPVGVASAASAAVASTSVVVNVLGPVERVARVDIPVLRDASISPALDHVVFGPGEVVTVSLARRPEARQRTVVVDLLDDQGRPLVAHRVAAGARTVRLQLPADRLGLFAVRVRPLDEGESLTGVGVIDRFIVRPAQPDFVAVEPVRRRWVVGETAEVRLRTQPNGPRAFAAVLVRDLSAHSGERDFRRSFLDGAFGRALLDPSNEAAERLTRAALAADPLLDPAPEVVPALVDALGMPILEPGDGQARPRGDLRDPYPASRELARRGLAEAMRVVESSLARALEEGVVDEVTVGRGTRRDFRPDLLVSLDPAGVQQTPFRTLGGDPLTPAILEAADPSFRFETVARRVARARLVRLWVALAGYLDPGDEATPAQRTASLEPFERWLPRMVEAGHIGPHDLDDPWGGHFILRPTNTPVLVVSARATRLELVSPGPDGRPGTRDDVRDPFERAVPLATPYAVASGEDALMRALAVLSPLEATLRAIRESYHRITVEMSEEEIGDAVFGDISEGAYGMGGLGLSGTGRGGGGSGYGSGRLAGRSSRAPRVRMGHAMVSGLSGVLRERFPPTLLFVPSVEIDASGTTPVPIPLADAVTTYVVEAIVWREDGWVWSDRTEIEVDRDIVVAAPIPPTAHRGDRLALPLRVSNRGATAREITLRLVGDRALGVADSAVHRVRLAPGGSEVVPVAVHLGRLGEGTLTVVATSLEGEALDAVRRPLRVLPLSRRVRAMRDALGDGSATVALDIPAGAHPRGGSVRVAVGDALFPPLDVSGAWARWSPFRNSGVHLDPDYPGGGGPSGPASHAMALTGLFRDDRVDDERVVQSLLGLTAAVEQPLGREQRGTESAETERQRALILAEVLLGVAPIAGHLARRPDVPEAAEFITRMRSATAERSLGISGAPALWVTAAAALGWSSADPDPAVVGELVRRVRRHVIVVGDDRWLAPEGARPVRSTLLLAMAELSLGRRGRALEYLATVGRWSILGHALGDDERALGRALLGRLLSGAEEGRVVARIDGEDRPLPLSDGAARLDAPEFGASGRHTVTVEAPRGTPVWVEATGSYAVSWDQEPRRAGPVAVSIEGSFAHVDEITELEIVVRNRTPRVIPSTVVEVELPTGAEVLAAQLGALARHTASTEQGEGVLRLVLPPLAPGRERRLPLSFRFSLEGSFRGFGAAAWAEDRPDAVTVLPPRRVELRRAAP